LACRIIVMIRDANATKARILEAATVEFADHGLAGARVDRLAARAGANKERIYANFGSKEALFDATVAANIEELLDTVPFDAEDLPGYAVRMFDFTLAHPQLVRLALWHGLERPGLLERLPQSVESTIRKVELLTAAQQAGLVDRALAPERLITVVLGLVYSGLLLAPPGDDAAEVAAQRESLRVAVDRLTSPGSR
jgi:AcrR family transcriptional regulator